MCHPLHKASLFTIRQSLPGKIFSKMKGYSLLLAVAKTKMYSNERSDTAGLHKVLLRAPKAVNWAGAWAVLGLLWVPV